MQIQTSTWNLHKKKGIAFFCCLRVLMLRFPGLAPRAQDKSVSSINNGDLGI